MAATFRNRYQILATKCAAEFPPHRLQKLQELIGALCSGGSAAAAGEQSVTQKAVAAAAAAEEAEPSVKLLERLEPEYASALRPKAYEDAEMSFERADGTETYAHYYRQNIADSPAEGMSRTKLKRLMSEISKLRKADGGGAAAEGALPVSAEASIYVRQVCSRETSRHHFPPCNGRSARGRTRTAWTSSRSSSRGRPTCAARRRRRAPRRTGLEPFGEV